MLYSFYTWYHCCFVDFVIHIASFCYPLTIFCSDSEPSHVGPAFKNQNIFRRILVIFLLWFWSFLKSSENQRVQKVAWSESKLPNTQCRSNPYWPPRGCRIGHTGKKIITNLFSDHLLKGYQFLVSEGCLAVDSSLARDNGGSLKFAGRGAWSSWESSCCCLVAHIWMWHALPNSILLATQTIVS